MQNLKTIILVSGIALLPNLSVQASTDENEMTIEKSTKKPLNIETFLHQPLMSRTQPKPKMSRQNSSFLKQAKETVTLPINNDSPVPPVTPLNPLIIPITPSGQGGPSGKLKFPQTPPPISKYPSFGKNKFFQSAQRNSENIAKSQSDTNIKRIKVPYQEIEKNYSWSIETLVDSLNSIHSLEKSKPFLPSLGMAKLGRIRIISELEALAHPELDKNGYFIAKNWIEALDNIRRVVHVMHEIGKGLPKTGTERNSPLDRYIKQYSEFTIMDSDHSKEEEDLCIRIVVDLKKVNEMGKGLPVHAFWYSREGEKCWVTGSGDGLGFTLFQNFRHFQNLQYYVGSTYSIVYKKNTPEE